MTYQVNFKNGQTLHWQPAALSVREFSVNLIPFDEDRASVEQNNQSANTGKMANPATQLRIVGIDEDITESPNRVPHVNSGSQTDENVDILKGDLQ